MNLEKLTDRQLNEFFVHGTDEEKEEAQKEFRRRIIERDEAENAKLTPEELKRKRAERFTTKLEDITFPLHNKRGSN